MEDPEFEFKTLMLEERIPQISRWLSRTTMLLIGGDHGGIRQAGLVARIHARGWLARLG